MSSLHYVKQFLQPAVFCLSKWIRNVVVSCIRLFEECVDAQMRVRWPTDEECVDAQMRSALTHRWGVRWRTDEECVDAQMGSALTHRWGVRWRTDEECVDAQMRSALTHRWGVRWRKDEECVDARMTLISAQHYRSLFVYFPIETIEETSLHRVIGIMHCRHCLCQMIHNRNSKHAKNMR